MLPTNHGLIFCAGRNIQTEKLNAKNKRRQEKKKNNEALLFLEKLTTSVSDDVPCILENLIRTENDNTVGGKAGPS